MRRTPVYRESGDTRLAELAARQHGVVATWQLLALGYTYKSIAALVAKGWLHRIHRGVYAVGHRRLSVEGRWMAAVLACGPDAVLSHGAAAALWELQRAPSGKIDITAPHKHIVAGVRCHVSRAPLHPDDRTLIDGIPVTSISRTLLDQAEGLRPQRLRSSSKPPSGAISSTAASSRRSWHEASGGVALLRSSGRWRSSTTRRRGRSHTSNSASSS